MAKIKISAWYLFLEEREIREREIKKTVLISYAKLFDNFLLSLYITGLFRYIQIVVSINRLIIGQKQLQKNNRLRLC